MQALKVIRMIYALPDFVQDKDAHYELILEYFHEQSHMQARKVSFKEAFCTNEMYTRASYVALLLVVSIAFNGEIAIRLYGNQIFDNILHSTGETFELTARQAVYIIGGLNIAGGVVSLFTVWFLGRKTILIFGNICIVISLLLAAYAYSVQAIMACVTLICLHSFIFSSTNAIVVWIYITETCQDVALGVGVICILTAALTVGATTFPLINLVGIAGFYAVFGVLSIVSLLFIYFCLGETKGLSNKQKKELFIPGGKYGRRLRPSEVVQTVDEDGSSELDTDNG